MKQLAKYRKTISREHSVHAPELLYTPNKEEKELRRAMACKRAAFAAVFSKVNAIVAGRNAPIKFGSSQWTFGRSGSTATPPGWTDGESVWINQEKFDTAIRRAVKSNNMLKASDVLTSFKGVNYHELAHILFTPRVGHKPIPQIRKLKKEYDASCRSGDSIMHCFNILEDQRIETLFTGRWLPAAKFFTLAVGEFIVSQAEKAAASPYEPARKSAATTHVLTHGRRYLPADLRAAMRDLFVAEFDEDTAVWVDALIDEYRLLVFPQDGTRAVELIEAFANWLNKQCEDAGQTLDDMAPAISKGHEHHRESKAGSPSDQREARDAVRDREDAEEDQSKPDSSQHDDTSASDDEEGNSDDGDTADDTNSDGTNSDGTSGAGTDSVSDAIKNVLDKAESIVAQAKVETQADIIDTLRSMKDHEDETHDRDVSRQHAARESVAPSSHAVVARRHITTALQQLRSDAEPTWLKRVDSGRINIPAFMSGQGIDLDVFDAWSDSGDDATSIEVVILLDQSSSMSRCMNSSSEAMWIIKSACDKLEIPCTVIGYSTGSSVLYSRDQVAGNNVNLFPTISSTEPQGALERAVRLFGKTDRRYKLLFSITDGQWFNEEACAGLVSEINQMGVSTNLIFLFDKPSWMNNDHWAEQTATYRDDLAKVRWHRHHNGVVCSSVNDMVKYIKRGLVRLVQDALSCAV